MSVPRCSWLGDGDVLVGVFGAFAPLEDFLDWVIGGDGVLILAFGISEHLGLDGCVIAGPLDVLVTDFIACLWEGFGEEVPVLLESLSLISIFVCIFAFVVSAEVGGDDLGWAGAGSGHGGEESSDNCEFHLS